jgi:hypothetical protein
MDGEPISTPLAAMTRDADVVIVEQGSEAEELAAQLALSLSLIQGIVLNHEASKVYLGRKPALEVCVCPGCPLRKILHLW